MQRFRRLRSSEAMRRMVRETRLDPADFIYPIFVCIFFYIFGIF